MALNWTKLPVLGTDGHAGYTATGTSGRFYSILKYGSGRFRLAAGGGLDDQKVGSLTALKTMCENIESVMSVAEPEGEQRETPTVPPMTGSLMIPVPPVPTTDFPGVTGMVGMNTTDGEVPKLNWTGIRPESDVEYPVKTACGATLLIAAESPEMAVTIARADGFLVAVDPPVVVPVPPVDPDTDLDFIVPNDRPTAPVPVPDVQPTEPHPDTETPLAPPEPVQNEPTAWEAAIDAGFYHQTFDRNSVPSVLGRAVMYRDMSWRSGGFLAPVRRYGTIRNNR